MIICFIFFEKLVKANPKYRTAENPGYVIQNWIRNRNTVRFLGLWEFP